MSQPSISVRLATNPTERAAAQRLRYEVFNLHAGLGLAGSHVLGLDADAFDPWCDHLLASTEDGRLVGTYRLLPEDAASESGFYAETEFDLAGLRARGWRLLELGRSCVHPEFRDGSVIRALFKALHGYQQSRAVDAMFGCVSLPGFDPIEVSGVMGFLHHHQLDGYPLARPYHPFPLPPDIHPDLPDPAVFWRLPPLFKAYLRRGARLAGPPAMDRAFGTTDFLLVLPVAAERRWGCAA